MAAKTSANPPPTLPMTSVNGGLGPFIMRRQARVNYLGRPTAKYLYVRFPQDIIELMRIEHTDMLVMTAETDTGRWRIVLERADAMGGER